MTVPQLGWGDFFMGAPANYDAALTQFDANSAYRESESVSEAKLFASACRYLLGNRPKDLMEGGEDRTTWGNEDLRYLLEQAEAWISSHDTGSTTGNRRRVRHLGFGSYRQ